MRKHQTGARNQTSAAGPGSNASWRPQPTDGKRSIRSRRAKSKPKPKLTEKTPKPDSGVRRTLQQELQRQEEQEQAKKSESGKRQKRNKRGRKIFSDPTVESRPTSPVSNRGDDDTRTPCIVLCSSSSSADKDPAESLPPTSSSSSSAASSFSSSASSSPALARAPSVWLHQVRSKMANDVANNARPTEAVVSKRTSFLGSETVHDDDSSALDGGDGDDAEVDQSLTVTETHWFQPPTYMDEEIWERHEYSVADVKRTLDCFSPRLLWNYLKALGAKPTPAAAKAQPGCSRSIKHGGKPTALNKCEQLLSKRHPAWKDRPSVLCEVRQTEDSAFNLAPDEKKCRPTATATTKKKTKMNSTGSSPLPVHKIDGATFEMLRKAKSEQVWLECKDADQHRLVSLAAAAEASAGTGIAATATTTHRLLIRKVDAVFKWRGIRFVVFEVFERGLEKMVRVVRVGSWEQHVAVHGMPRSLADSPNIIFAGPRHGYCVLHPETFFFRFLGTTSTGSAPVSTAAASVKVSTCEGASANHAKRSNNKRVKI